MLLDEITGELKVHVAEGPRAKTVVGKRQQLGQGIAGWVAKTGKPLLLHGALEDEEFADPDIKLICRRGDVRDALCTPLVAEDETIGVISLSNRLGPTPFSTDDLDLLTGLANQAALAIRNARAYDDIRRQRTTVERLLHEVTRAQEEERRRIAVQIHDGPAQTMFAALRNLQTVQAVASEHREKVPELMEGVEKTILTAIEETRGVMLDLRPSGLDDLGLIPTLKGYARHFEQRTGIRTEVVRQGRDMRLPAMYESCFYRIAVEALTNVWKHSGAANARITVEILSRTATLEVSDNGSGYDPNAQSEERERSLGIPTLYERAELIGGKLEIRSVPKEGTTVSVTAPLAEG
jgi:signal transduction histidine kinase